MPEGKQLPPHPEREEEPEAPEVGRGGVIAAVVIGAIFLILVALHLTGAVPSHGG